MHDIIPDIHGQGEKLHALLPKLGWRRGAAGWINDAPEREIVFLGDVIDRGPDNAGVIRTVRSLMDAGKARAVMGNHELNALHYHTRHPRTGEPLRARSAKNTAQHRTFLEAFPPDAPATREVLAWMRSLPLYLETARFRAVHACWDEAVIAALVRETRDGVLDEDQLVAAADKNHALHARVETTTKGPEAPLPEGHVFHDKEGRRREHVRLKWWQGEAASWTDIAISVPDAAELPPGPLPEFARAGAYPADARPVFFGHYWLYGRPALQASNALCLDYSAGGDGPLLAYRVQSDAARLDVAHIVSADGSGGRKSGRSES